MTPSADQSAHLQRMETILSPTWKALLLARSLWEFFEFRLACTVHEDDGVPSTTEIQGIHSPTDIGDVGIVITVRRTERTAEALVHELLHANMIASPYPIFHLDEPIGSPKWFLGRGIINEADHVVIRPIFTSFGYDASRFMGRPPQPLSEEDQRLTARIHAAAAELATPEGYAAFLATEFCRHEIVFEPLYLGRRIAQRA